MHDWDVYQFVYLVLEPNVCFQKCLSDFTPCCCVSCRIVLLSPLSSTSSWSLSQSILEFNLRRIIVSEEASDLSCALGAEIILLASHLLLILLAFLFVWEVLLVLLFLDDDVLIDVITRIWLVISWSSSLWSLGSNVWKTRDALHVVVNHGQEVVGFTLFGGRSFLSWCCFDLETWFARIPGEDGDRKQHKDA